MASVFISYRRDDSPGHAGRLFDVLRANLGDEEVFMDVAGISGGEQYKQLIDKAIRTARVMLVVVGPFWNRQGQLASKQDWIYQEVALALRHKVHLLLVRVNGAPLPARDDVPPGLRRLLQYHAIELRDDRWDSDIPQVRDSIKLLLSPELANRRLRRRRALRVLVCHDVAAADADGAWERRCRTLISNSVNRWSAPPVPVETSFVSCAPLFEERLRTIPPSDLFGVTSRLLSQQDHPVAGEFGAYTLGAATSSERVAGAVRLVSCWLMEEGLRRQAAGQVGGELRRFVPDVVLAYGLGALLAYDALSTDSGTCTGTVLVTLASAFSLWPVRNVFGGRVTVPRAVRTWLDLTNPQDGLATRPLHVAAPNFVHLEAFLGAGGSDAQTFENYLGHATMRNRFWPLVVTPARRAKRTPQVFQDFFFRPPVPQRRALLVGIGDYPDPEDRLRGSVNDVFLTSSVLQEAGFEAENIAVLANERAHTARIRERLEWLLEGVKEGQQRVFYFSGHGAVIPSLRLTAEAGSASECLAPYDFDWSLERCIPREFLEDLYSQLPYSASFLVLLDCGFPTVGKVSAHGTRGLSAPEDILHSLQAWDRAQQEWVVVERTCGLVSDMESQEQRDPKFISTVRRVRRKYNHRGPYLPVTIVSCHPRELCLELRHGTSWYGAFTYVLSACLRGRRYRRTGTLTELLEQVTRGLSSHGIAQHPWATAPHPVPASIAALGLA